MIADDVFTYKLETKYFINVVLTRTAYGKLVKKKEQFVMDYRLLNTCMFVMDYRLLNSQQTCMYLAIYLMLKFENI